MGGRALDIACGAGRNAVYLASCGYQVSAIDISLVALKKAKQRAEQAGVDVNWICADLLADRDATAPADSALPSDESMTDNLAVPAGGYDLIIMFRFVAPELLDSLVQSLAPGGRLIVEEHLQTTAEVAGPSSPQFRVAPGALRQALSTLQIVRSFEGEVVEPDGTVAALARIIARKDPKGPG
jgi:SAM-dependent methyltransferase